MTHQGTRSRWKNATLGLALLFTLAAPSSHGFLVKDAIEELVIAQELSPGEQLNTFRDILERIPQARQVAEQVAEELGEQLGRELLRLERLLISPLPPEESRIRILDRGNHYVRASIQLLLLLRKRHEPRALVYGSLAVGLTASVAMFAFDVSGLLGESLWHIGNGKWDSLQDLPLLFALITTTGTVMQAVAIPTIKRNSELYWGRSIFKTFVTALFETHGITAPSGLALELERYGESFTKFESIANVVTPLTCDFLLHRDIPELEGTGSD